MDRDTDLPDNNGEQPGDNFYHGIIKKIFWNNATGVVRSDSGKDIPFIFAFVTLLGAPRQDINFLRAGMRVGFDVGWTSRGLRISTIKIYDLYQDDLVPDDVGGSTGESALTSREGKDHPISRYRPRDYTEPEPARYRPRRPPQRTSAPSAPTPGSRPAEQQNEKPQPSPVRPVPARTENERERPSRPRPPRRFKGPRDRS